MGIDQSRHNQPAFGVHPLSFRVLGPQLFRIPHFPDAAILKVQTALGQIRPAFVSGNHFAISH
ncbi:hypothetical protein SDC9_208171 [bioreactor metagenome]|uniref:Uncharacterized protein n=1 Tax=bioreactor metagenome TaxID=1076179 RepID=A0A645JLD2_9ZZZZ